MRAASSGKWRAIFCSEFCTPTHRNACVIVIAVRFVMIVIMAVSVMEVMWIAVNAVVVIVARSQ